jgi:hypothetical protein
MTNICGQAESTNVSDEKCGLILGPKVNDAGDDPILR